MDRETQHNCKGFQGILRQRRFTALSESGQSDRLGSPVDDYAVSGVLFTHNVDGTASPYHSAQRHCLRHFPSCNRRRVAIRTLKHGGADRRREGAGRGLTDRPCLKNASKEGAFVQRNVIQRVSRRALTFGLGTICEATRYFILSRSFKLSGNRGLVRSAPHYLSRSLTH